MTALTLVSCTNFSLGLQRYTQSEKKRDRGMFKTHLISECVKRRTDKTKQNKLKQNKTNQNKQQNVIPHLIAFHSSQFQYNLPSVIFTSLLCGHPLLPCFNSAGTRSRNSWNCWRSCNRFCADPLATEFHR
jgi:hypothetical protein